MVLAGRSLAAEILLTTQELAYRNQAQEIRMCVDPDWPPFEGIDSQGRHIGIAADLVQLAAQRTGLHISLYPTRNWEESLAASKNGRCKLMSFLNQSAEREAWLTFTRPILVDRNIIVTREEHPFVADLGDLSEKTIVLPNGTMVEERVRRDFPRLKVITTNSEAEAMTYVAERKADLTVRSMIVTAHAIRQQGLFHLKIAGQVPAYVNQLRIGIVKSEPILRDILDKGVASITIEEREAIVNKHVPVLIQQPESNRIHWFAIFIAIALLSLSVFWYRRAMALQRLLIQHTAEEGSSVLLPSNMIQERLETECLRAQRYGLSLSVIIIEFRAPESMRKSLNPDTGFLTSLAARVNEQTREVDSLGRLTDRKWLLVCPHSGHKEILDLAGRLQEMLQCQTDVVEKEWRIWLGIGTYQLGDRSSEVIQRTEINLR